MKITNGIEHTQFIQLANGVKKKAYGNLLVDFSVKRFCDTFTWYKYGQNWKIGNPKTCGWKEEDLNAYLPIEILKEDITGIHTLSCLRNVAYLEPLIYPYSQLTM